MRLHEEFTVDQPVAAVWQLLEQPEMVARCMPGVEQIRVVDPDTSTSGRRRASGR